jgi:alginate O-acetyltransferase complex protein AlgI
MTFNSLSFFLFLPAVWLVFYVAADRWRWLVLLLASYAFYAALGVPYLLGVLLGVTGITYGCGLWLGRAGDDAKRKGIFWGGVVLNLAVLVGMKYLPFLEENLNRLFHGIRESPLLPVHPVLVGIGVSYFVFQAISYLADVYMEIQEPEPHAGRFALYMAFFPKLLQGPIERAGDLLPQLKQPYRFDYDNMRSGLLLFTWGLFKKVVIADRLALYVNAVYGDVHAWSGLPLLLATYFYALQIYFDFSGYTDMALGTGRLFNLRLTQNFNSPYLATSVADFWRRWHISFSRWILDYIFKPLQMTWRNWGTKGTAGMAAALLVTFLASGLWHGARWGYVVWGLTHGVFLAVSVYWNPHQKRIHKALGLEKTGVLRVWQTFVTFHLVCFSWIFFRAASISDALYVMNNLFTGLGNYRGILFQHGATELAALLMGLSILFAVRLMWTPGREMRDYPPWLRWGGYIALAEWLLLFNIDIQRAFIYFQF